MYLRACRAAIPAALTAARSGVGLPSAGEGAGRTVAEYRAASETMTRPLHGASLAGTRNFFSSAWDTGLQHPHAFSGRGELCVSSRGLSTQEGRDEAGEGERGAEEDEAEEKAGEGSGRDEKVVLALKEDLAKSEEQLKDTREKALYLAAEMENVRAIAKRDAEGARLYAVQKFAKQLLDVADNLERAVVSAKEGKRSGGDSAHDVLLQGVEMTSDELQKVFRSQGLEKYGETGDKFNPHLHDAMFAYPDPAQEPGTVGQVLKCGYKLHDRVIRAAQVGTVKDA